MCVDVRCGCGRVCICPLGVRCKVCVWVCVCNHPRSRVYKRMQSAQTPATLSTFSLPRSPTHRTATLLKPEYTAPGLFSDIERTEIESADRIER